VLQIFAATARANIGSSGLVGRWGGDEFAAVLYDVTRNDATAMARRIQAAFEKAANQVDLHSVQATASIGIVFSTAGALDLPALLVQADQALYSAKELGRNRIEVMSADTVWNTDRAVLKTKEEDVVPAVAPRQRMTAA
jgi:diguanylate cyclase (GGDEF)-like protein